MMKMDSDKLVRYDMLNGNKTVLGQERHFTAMIQQANKPCEKNVEQKIVTLGSNNLRLHILISIYHLKYYWAAMLKNTNCSQYTLFLLS
jgi:hypothetical protein